MIPPVYDSVIKLNGPSLGTTRVTPARAPGINLGRPRFDDVRAAPPSTGVSGKAGREGGSDTTP
eukprot:751606-Hanusia_phi.AAC.1